jgi:hypothetical protein
MNVPVSVRILAKTGIYRLNTGDFPSTGQGSYFLRFHQILIHLTPALFFCSLLAVQPS